MASSSSAWGSAIDIPRELRAALQASRPACPHWSTWHCRKGDKCPLRHDGGGDDVGDPPLWRLPHASMRSDGGVSLRPPLMLGLKKWWSRLPVTRPCPLSHGESWQLSGSAGPEREVVTFVVLKGSMVSPNLCTCAEVVTPNGCWAKWGTSKTFSWRGATSNKAPGFLLHPTTVEAALNILKDGQINHSPGIAGEGIYCLQIDADSADKGNQFAIEQTWRRGASGGDIRGAAFVLEVHGILCMSKSGDELGAVPPGVILMKNNQYVAHRGAVSYYSVSFQRDALLSVISREMDEQGYPKALHAALVAIQAHLSKTPSRPPPAQAVTLLSGTPEPPTGEDETASKRAELGRQAPQTPHRRRSRSVDPWRFLEPPQQQQQQEQEEEPQQPQAASASVRGLASSQQEQLQSQWWQPQQSQPQQWRDGQWYQPPLEGWLWRQDVPYLLPTTYDLRPTTYDLLPTTYLLSTYYPLPATHYPHYPLPTTHYPLPTTHYTLPTTHYPLPTTHYPLPTTPPSGLVFLAMRRLFLEGSHSAVHHLPQQQTQQQRPRGT
jgi:hypothetical protein